MNSFEELPNLKEIKDLFAGPRHAKWRAFRESEDARHVALTGPRFMLRSAYHPQEQPIESFNYNEDIAGQHDNYLWGNSAFLLASCINDSFARYRWCPNIIGPNPAVLSKTCRSICTNPWASCRPRFLPRC